MGPGWNRKTPAAGELDPVKPQAQHAGERLGEKGLPHPWYVFDQEAPAGDQAGQGKSDRGLFAQNQLPGRRNGSVDLSLHASVPASWK